MTGWLDGQEVRRRSPQMVLEAVIGGAFHPNYDLVEPDSVVMSFFRGAKQNAETFPRASTEKL